jgi:hypothetical protein
MTKNTKEVNMGHFPGGVLIRLCFLMLGGKHKVQLLNVLPHFENYIWTYSSTVRAAIS